MLTIDFETYYDKDYSLTKLTPEQYIHDPRFQVIGVAIKYDDNPTQWFTGDDGEIRLVIESLRETIERGAVLMHNAQFDASILAWRYHVIPRVYLDSMLMARPWVTPYTGRMSLASIAQYFQLPPKGTQVHSYRGYRRESFSPAELRNYGDYCKHDTGLSYEIFQRLKAKFSHDELRIIDRIIRLYTQPKFELDAAILAKHLQQVRAEKEQLINQAGLTDRTRLMSNPLFAELLKSLGVDPPTKISPTTGKETFAFAKTDLAFKALADHWNPKVQAAHAARVGLKSTLEETRTERFLTHALTGRPFPIPLLYYGAHTGRLSGQLKLNCQNLTRGSALRKAMRAPPGHVVLAVDSRQIEARLNAWAASEHVMTQQFRNKEDVYAKFASHIYGYEVTEETHPDERRVGKLGILSLGYGAGGNKFYWLAQSSGINLSKNRAFDVVGAYRRTYECIAYQWELADVAVHTLGSKQEAVMQLGPCYARPGFVLLPNGMQLTYNDVRYEDGRICYSYGKQTRTLYGAKLVENIIQALARCIVMWQLLQVPERWQFAMQAHDELVFIVKESEADEALAHILGVMRMTPSWADGLYLDAAGGYGDSYGDAK